MIAQDYTERFNPWCLNSILVKFFENNNQQLSKSIYFILFSLFGCPCINVFFGHLYTIVKLCIIICSYTKNDVAYQHSSRLSLGSDQINNAILLCNNVTADHYLLFDFPGQVELFFLYPNAKNVIMRLIKKLNLRVGLYSPFVIFVALITHQDHE